MNQAPVTTHIFPASCMTWINQDYNCLRPAPLWRHLTNLGLCSCSTTRNLSGLTVEGACFSGAVVTLKWSSHSKCTPQIQAAFAVSLLLHSTTEQVSLSDHFYPLVSGQRSLKRDLQAEMGQREQNKEEGITLEVPSETD